MRRCPQLSVISKASRPTTRVANRTPNRDRQFEGDDAAKFHKCSLGCSGAVGCPVLYSPRVHVGVPSWLDLLITKLNALINGRFLAVRAFETVTAYGKFWLGRPSDFEASKRIWQYFTLAKILFALGTSENPMRHASSFRAKKRVHFRVSSGCSLLKTSAR